MANVLLFVLVGLGVITQTYSQCLVGNQNGTLVNNGSCSSFTNSTFSGILSCSGTQLANMSQGGFNALKGFSDAVFDLYTVVRSRLDISLVVNAINNNRRLGLPVVGLLSNVDFARLWFEVKIAPYMSSLSPNTLFCLSQSNLTCSSFQALVQDFSSQTGPNMQNMVYQNFLKPFLTGNTIDVGCLKNANSSLQWLQLNFQNFSTVASLSDFTTLNPNFTGLDVLNVLSPGQKAELFFQMEASGTLSNNAISQIVFSFPPIQRLTLNNTNIVNANFTDILQLLKPFGQFVQTLVSAIQLTGFTNCNWTLPANANQNAPNPLNICNFNDWLQYVVIPVIKTFLQSNLTSDNVTTIFNTVFAESVPVPNPVDVCVVTSNSSSCAASQPEALALTCVAQSNLSFTEQNLQLVITALSSTMQQQLNSSRNALVFPVELPAESFTDGNLGDVDFMSFWFQTKMKPILPEMTSEYLSCLSTRDFSCPVYSALVQQLSDNIGLMSSDTQNMVFSVFIIPFLSRRLNSSADCTVPFNNSVDFIVKNFGSFSALAPLQLFSYLSSNFSALDAVPVLSADQLDELLLNLPTNLSAQINVITTVFGFLLQPSNQNQLINFQQSSFSCANYNTIFNALDQAISSASPNTSQSLLTFRDSLMTIPPDGCLSLSSQCAPIPVNGSAMCASVNSIPSGQFVNGLTPNSPGPQNLCNISILQLACQPSLPPLNPQQVAGLLACNLPGNVTKQTWKLFFSRIGLVLDDALLTLSNMVPSPNNLSLTGVLDAIGDVRINRFSPQRLKDPVFMTSWFQVRLQPFLPSISPGLLSCLSTKNLSCQTYRIITNSLASTVKNGPVMCGPSPANVSQSQNLIYNNFILAYLSRNDTDNPRCLSDTNSSVQWVSQNFGPFFQSASLSDLQKLNSNFSAADVLPLMSLAQLLQFAATPGALLDPRLVSTVMQLVPNCQLASFFDFLSSNIQNILLTTDGKTVLITQIFNRANLSSSTMPDGVVVFWIQNRLGPLLTNLSDSLVAPLFSILNTRDCNISQSAILLLDSIQPSLSNNTKQAIYNNIIQSLKGPPPLKCYQNNSFIAFLNSSLFGFGPLPDLTTFLSLIPSPRTPQIINFISPSELGSYLNQPGVTNNNPAICAIFNNYARTPQFLDTQVVPDNVKPAMLPCIWPLALTSNNVTEVNSWFGHRLAPFLPFLNVTLLGLVDTLNTSCLSFKKMVSVLESNFTFNGSMITSQDVYNAIAIYLQSASVPKCYNSTDPMFNSTTWFVDYIGAFISYLSLNDLYSFGNIQIFTVDPNNILLFSLFALPQNVTSRFAQLIYLQNPNFNVLNLPVVLQCDAPVTAFTSVQTSLVSTILGNFTAYCTNVDPQVLTALSGRLPTIDASVIKNLGNDSVGLTTSQLTSVNPSVLISGLSTLSTVSGWSFGQAQIIVQQLFSGNFQVTNSSNLESLGSLVSGIPSTTLAAISPQQILQTTQNVQFVNNILASPPIIQMTYVTQIIQVNPSISVLMTNVPDAMAVQIPRNLLSIPTGSATVGMAINNKSWKPEQAALFFDSVASVFNDSDSLSVDVLQGFSCTRVQTFSNIKVQGLIKACRLRAGRPKVVLVETQLTCMYNLIKVNSPLDFVNYPPDMLMYFDYQTIPQANCTGYFSGLANADFSVISSALGGNKNLIWNNARNCLGITGTSIQKNNLQILGNIVCVVSSTFIANSDPEILENLKNCNELSAQQITAAENLLLGGTSKYGTTATWNQMTLNNLGILPLYFSQNFWSQFQLTDTHTFLKTFLPYLRGINTPKPQMKALFSALIAASPRIAKRATCTKNPITSVIIADDAFPYGYSAPDFTNCINSTVLLQNLAALCAKIDDSGSQRAILNQLDAALPNGLSDSQVQVLKSVSRNATVSELSQWSITKIDTLAALMDVNDGVWLPAQSKQIVTNFLNANNNLTSTVLNLLTGPNICSLSNTTLATITVASMSGTNALDVSSCSSDNKKVLFTTANQAFPLPSTKSQSSALTTYQLIEPYLGGANLAYIRSLIAFNVSMSLSTFINLDPSVISGLSVSDVVGLLGNNLPDLKTFENETVVANWISNQPQSELDKLNLGLTGGRAAVISSTAATNSSINSTVATTVTTTLTTITSATTKSSASPGYRGTGWAVSFTALALLFTLIL